MALCIVASKVAQLKSSKTLNCGFLNQGDRLAVIIIIIIMIIMVNELIKTKE